MEWIISGYCRVQDQARTVMLEFDGTQWDCDCDFPGCPFARDCPLGKQMIETQAEQK